MYRLEPLIVSSYACSDPQNIPEITTPARAFESRGGPNDWAYRSTMINRDD